MRRLLAPICFVLLAGTASSALALKQVETEHYVVVFQPEVEFWAHKVIQVAEEVWDDLVTAYDLRDQYQKIYIYVEDPGDFANGFSIPNKNRTTVYTTSLEIGIRGSDNWIRNVVTHELAHVFSIKAADKDHFLDNFTVSTFSRYQNPDWAAAFRYSNLLAPTWWVEGVAQYEAYKNKNDLWDSHRDMFLRMAVLEDDLLNYVQMSTFDNRNGFYPEMTYNQGYAMMLYLDSAYGEQAVRAIAKAKSFFTFNHSLSEATGKRGEELYQEWRKNLRAKYGRVADEVRKNLREGSTVFDGGFWDYYGAASPDGRHVALISNRGYDVLYPNLYLLDRASGDLRRVRTRGLESVRWSGPGNSVSSLAFGGKSWLAKTSFGLTGMSSKQGASDCRETPVVLSRVQWFPDGKKLCYSRWTKGTALGDVYVYDIDKERERQISWHARAMDPAVSPDGKTIAYVENRGGVQNLALVDVDGRNTRLLTQFNNGTQLYSPCWMPDGKKVVVGILYEKNRDIAVVNAEAVPFDRVRKLTDSTFFPDSLNYQPDLDLMLMVHSTADERDPFVSSDGAFLYFSSDRTGIFNVYRMDLRSWKVEQVTNVLGGAFAPSLDKSGKKLIYTGFHAANFSIYELPIDKPDSVTLTYVRKDYRKRFKDPLLFSAAPKNGQYSQGEYKPRLTLWDFGPFLSFQPAFVTDTVGLSHFRTGLNLALGELHGAVGMAGSVYLAKDFTDHAGPSWGANVQLAITSPELLGENSSIRPQAFAFGAHEVNRSEQTLTPHYSGDLRNAVPNQRSYLVPPDTVVAVYMDDISGEYRDERVFDYYGAVGSLSLTRLSQIGLHYARLNDYVNTSIFDRRIRTQSRAFRLNNGRFDGAVDLTGKIRGDGRTSSLDTALEGLNDTSSAYDMLGLQDRFPIYQDHAVGVNYQFSNVRPSFEVPDRADLFGLGAQFLRSNLTVDLFGAGNDTVLERENANSIFTRFGSDGYQVPSYTAVQQKQDFFKLEVFLLERVPLPLEKAMSHAPRPLRLKHFLTGSAFLGGLNRRLPVGASTYPLEYRTGSFLKAYPFRFNPIDLGYRQSTFPVVNVETGETDSVPYLERADLSDVDILRGNGIMYYSLEYTLEVLRGLTLSPLGMLVKGVYLTPFFETAAVWDRNWEDMDASLLAPVTYRDRRVHWRASFLRDAGLRVEVPFILFDTWEAYFAFTWARRLDLDDKAASISRDGEYLIGLDKDKFSFTFYLW